jgi:hypothetical protein
MKRIGFRWLLVWIICILVMVVFMASLAVRQPTQALQPSSTTTMPFAAHAPVSAEPVGGSRASAPTVLPGPSSFDQALSSERLAHFSH